jgi:magnesium transporter
MFQTEIEKVVALAVLMPIVASMGGNAGTQTLTVAVRALAVRELTGSNAIRVLGKEMLVGTINGIAFAVLMGVVAYFWFGEMEIAIVIGAAMVVNLIVANLAGLLIPLGLDRAGGEFRGHPDDGNRCGRVPVFPGACRAGAFLGIRGGIVA